MKLSVHAAQSFYLTIHPQIKWIPREISVSVQKLGGDGIRLHSYVDKKNTLNVLYNDNNDII